MKRLIIWGGTAAIVFNFLMGMYFLKRANEAATVLAHFDEYNRKEMAARELRKNKLTDFVFNKSTRISKATAQQIVAHASAYRNCLLLLAVMKEESEYNPGAISKIGARGLGQVNYAAHKKLLSRILRHPRDLHDIGINFVASDHILSGCLVQANNDIDEALSCYLGGKDGKYISRILTNLAHLYLLTR